MIPSEAMLSVSTEEFYRRVLLFVSMRCFDKCSMEFNGIWCDKVWILIIMLCSVLKYCYQSMKHEGDDN